jgi:hypothetical protein
VQEWADDPETYRLLITCAGGAYEIELSMPGSLAKSARGRGLTLSEAWESAAPSCTIWYQRQ